MYEIYKLPQGKIVFSCTTKDLNTGVLYLDPHQELAKHKRPVPEQLAQIVGICVVKIFDGENLMREVALNENNTLTIPANQFHAHTNPTDALSVTMWKFEGDISEEIQKIREGNDKIL